MENLLKIIVKNKESKKIAILTYRRCNRARQNKSFASLFPFLLSSHKRPCPIACDMFIRKTSNK